MKVTAVYGVHGFTGRECDQGAQNGRGFNRVQNHGGYRGGNRKIPFANFVNLPHHEVG
jgi:hypothetical protein